MQEFLNWTIDTIREDKLISPWLEEKKYEWTPLVSKSITALLDKGCSVIIVTDNDRNWFLEYVLTHINTKSLNRPYLPFYDFKSFYSDIPSLTKKSNTQKLVYVACSRAKKNLRCIRIVKDEQEEKELLNFFSGCNIEKFDYIVE